MKKNTLISVFLLLNIFIVFGQCPITNIELHTQEEIDNFAINYPNCTTLTHELKIDGESGDITNLNGLSEITIAQDIFIIQTGITSFIGLDNVEYISSLALWGNSYIQDLSGLSSVEEIGSLEIWINSSISSLDGLDSIQSFNNINLFANSSLEDISKLSFLNSIGNLTIGGNGLSDLNGLQNLVNIEEDLTISNEQIQNFNELNNLQTIGGSLYLLGNSDIQNVLAFTGLETIDELYILDCPNLINLSGLENLTTINGTLRIGFNSELTDLSFLKNIITVGNLDIYENENLQTLQGIESIKHIEDRLFIDNNPVLTSIEALKYIELPSDIDQVVIMNNSSLEICKNEFICSIINDDNVSKYIYNNASGCNSIEEIEEVCSLDVESPFLGNQDVILDNQVFVYPNPISEMFTIRLNESNFLNNVKIYSLKGELVLESKKSQISIDNYLPGVYFLEINTNNGVVLKRIIKD